MSEVNQEEIVQEAAVQEEKGPETAPAQVPPAEAAESAAAAPEGTSAAAESASPEAAAQEEPKPKKPRAKKKKADGETAAPKKKADPAAPKKKSAKKASGDAPKKKSTKKEAAPAAKTEDPEKIVPPSPAPEAKPEKKGETTTTFNDEDIADLAKLTAVNSRGDHMQFSLGRETEIRFGEKPDIVKGVLTLDCNYFGIPQFKIKKRHHWEFINCNLKTTTYINGVKVEDLEPRKLENGSLIRVSLGNRSQVMVFEDSYDPKVEWRTLLLSNKSKPITIYSSEAMKQMSDANVARKHSKEYPHAEFVFVSGKWTVKDVNIGKGIHVNGEKIKKQKELELYDVIQIGQTIYVYLSGRLVYNLSSGSRKSLIIDIADRTVKTGFARKKVLLKDISLTIEPGSLVLLLGGSGAGKTTFINAVTGYEPANAKILNGGVDVYENYDQMKYEIGVVPQQDLLRGTDTVYMTLYNAAELRIPTDYTIREIKTRVKDTLELFGLLPYKNSLVKSLSGGQRKRLSIACEYIGDPSLFILDEPDSGLDGVIARELIERLRKIADAGKIVIVITHTPDRVIDLFDHIIVLAKDSKKTGRLAFYGTIDEARKFFGKEKMEDIVKAVNTPEEGGEGRADELIAAFDQSRRKEDTENA